MLNRLLVTSILTSINLLFFGQSISWSDAMNLDDFRVSNIYSTSDSTIYVIKQNKEKQQSISYDIFGYDLAKQTSGSVTVEMDAVNKVSLFNDELYVFGVKYHKEKDELVVQKIDQSGKKLGAPKSLLTCTSNGGYHANFDISLSPRGSFVAIIGTDGYTSDQKEIIHSILFDNEWKEHHHKEVNTSILSEKRTYNAITVNDNGVTYIMKREKKKGADKYYVFCISESGVENHHELHLKSRNIMDVKYDMDTLGNLFLAGFYAPPNKSLYEGFYIKKITPEGTEEFSKEYMFNEDVVMTFSNKKEVKEFGYGLSKFHTSYFSFVNDKSLVLEAEHSTRSKTKDGNFEYINNGFVLINLSEKGGFQYATPINTLQTDDKHNGFWNSHCHVNYMDQDLIYLNLLGDGAKGVKEDLPSNAHLHTFQIKLTSNGIEKRELQNFDVSVEDFAIYPDYKNYSSLPLLIVKSKNQDQYAIGLLE